MVLWIALAVAFSPTLLDLAHNFDIEPYDRCTIGPALLLGWWAVAMRGERQSGHSDGLVLILIGVAMQVLGILTLTWSMARFGVPFAVIGAARMTGLVPLRLAVLAFFAIPVPYSVMLFMSPDLEIALASLASQVANVFGASLTVDAIELRSGDLRLHLVPQDGGLVLLPLFMALGWFHALRARAEFKGTLARVSVWVLALLPLQIVGLAIAGLLTDAGNPELARAWLRDLLWPVIAVVGLGGVIAGTRRHASLSPAGH
jgi:hypothetical protein